jgi:acyl-CoA thioesterase FadM
MSYPSIFSYRFTVPQGVIDENGHVNNVAYVQWMQDAATIHHPQAVGYVPAENTTWYARAHRVEYLLPASLGEEIEVRTWISEVRCVRGYMWMQKLVDPSLSRRRYRHCSRSSQIKAILLLSGNLARES